jgi:hypothetical protein
MIEKLESKDLVVNIIFLEVEIVLIKGIISNIHKENMKIMKEEVDRVLKSKEQINNKEDLNNTKDTSNQEI